MALSCAAVKVFDSGTLPVAAGSWGVVKQADGSYVFGWQETDFSAPYTATGHWHRSTDDGRTWATMGTSDGLFGQMGSFSTNVQTNIIVAPYYIPWTNEAGIMRTVNGGATWNSVYLEGVAPAPNGQNVIINGSQSYDLNKVITWGELSGNASIAPQLYATSSDAGANWTTHSTWDAGDRFDQLNAFGLAANGVWYAQYTKLGGVNRSAWLARSDDYGTSWTVVNSMGSISSPPWPVATTIACFDENTFAMGGVRGAIPFNSQPGLWWSNDAGTTLHLLSSGDIVNWPGGSGRNDTQEIKRLTIDACVVAFDNQNGSSPGSCWAISTDQGHTYDVAVTQASGVATYQAPYGKIVVTKEGALLLPLWQSDSYTDSRVTLWRAPILC